MASILRDRAPAWGVARGMRGLAAWRMSRHDSSAHERAALTPVAGGWKTCNLARSCFHRDRGRHVDPGPAGRLERGRPRAAAPDPHLRGVREPGPARRGARRRVALAARLVRAPAER